MVAVLQVGEIVRATVTRTEVYGLYLSSRGQGLFVPIPDIAWTTEFRDCRDIAKVGDEFDVRVMAFDDRKGLHWGSIKDAHPEDDPWRDPTAFAPGSVWVGTVTIRYAASDPERGPSGYLVRLRPGVSGFLKESDVGETLALGDRVEVQIAEADERSRKIWLRPCLGRQVEAD